MKTELISISKIKNNPDNPRLIKDDKFRKLVQSIKDFPKMLELRPIVVNSEMVVLGGNMRLKACKEAGLKKVHIVKADTLTEDEQKEFIIKDNVSFGENDWDILANDWDMEQLDDWGMDLPNWDQDKNDVDYSKKIEAPIYEPKNKKPSINTLFDYSKTEELIKQINDSKITEKEKTFLKLAAHRHCVFSYQDIADYYAHSKKETQELMEDSALVIIDFDKAIENGYVSLSEEIKKQYTEDNGE